MSSDREVNDELIMLLKDCGIYDSIELLNNKIYSIIGHEFDIEGVDFSGGQRQKLAIARAMYKNGNIIILDEPTAALDAKAENEIFSQMKTLAKEKTAIFISHRLYSARFCDRILVFASHKIIEDGTHEVLLKQKGLYCEMFNLQAQYYEGDDI